MKSEEIDSEYITFESLRKMIGVSDINLLVIYLKEIYKDLSTRNNSNAKKGISKTTFYEYIKLPVFISEKLFSALDQYNDGYLS